VGGLLFSGTFSILKKYPTIIPEAILTYAYIADIMGKRLEKEDLKSEAI
jgi:hypothetical protein